MSSKAKIFVGLGVTAAFVVGMGAGAAAGPADDTSASHKPGQTRTVYQNADSTTPQSCLDALDAADTIINDAGDFANTVVQMTKNSHRAVIAAYNHDVAAMTAVVTDIQSNTNEIKTETQSVQRHGAIYQTKAADCRADTP